MATSIAQKLRIKKGFRLLTLNAPSHFAQSLDGLPSDVKVSASLKAFEQIHWFVKKKAAMEEELSKVLPMLTGDVVCWIYLSKREFQNPNGPDPR